MSDQQEMPPGLLAQIQREQDHHREQFHKAVTEAQATPEDLRRLLLLNLTTRPSISYTHLALSWMQRDPAAWAGYHPEQCENVGHLMAHREDI